MIKTLKNAFKNLKKYVLVTAHLNFNFWYCNPISKAKQGHKLKFSCPKWAFCHKSSLLFSFLSCPTQLLERGESQHVKYFLGTGNYFFLWVSEGHKSIKGPSPLTWFTITIENSNTSKYSTGEKGERGKRKQSLFIEGTLLWYFFLPSYLSKQHKCNCLSKTNEAVKSHRPRYRLAFIDLWMWFYYRLL